MITTTSPLRARSISSERLFFASATLWNRLWAAFQATSRCNAFSCANTVGRKTEPLRGLGAGATRRLGDAEKRHRKSEAPWLPATISALAAWAAAAAAAIAVGFQFFVGRRQAEAAFMSATAALKNAENAGRQKIAESRQAWINSVIDTLRDHQAILASPGADGLSQADARQLAGLKTKLRILLNPDEPDTVALLAVIDKMNGRGPEAEFAAAEAEMLVISRRLLKREWVRIKTELGHAA